MSWVRQQLEYLRRWREEVTKIVRALELLSIDAEVYVIGSAAEGRLTVFSDIDVLICVNKEELDDKEAFNIAKKVLLKAIDDLGLPFDYPIELHVHSRARCEEILRKYCRKYIKIR